MRKIVINGANGFVASNFIHELLNQGYEVIALVRGNNNEHSKQRMLNALYEISSEGLLNFKNLTVCNYSLLENDFLIAPELLSNIFDGNVDFFHFAASLKYSEKTRDEIFETNIGGIENSIKIFQKYSTKGSQFFFISTAYSCGKITGKFEEKFYDNENILGFRNYYEQSKRFAENVIKKHIINDGLNAYIIRPSQVVGNNKTGITKTDFGIFDFTKRICNLAYRYPGETVRIKVNPDATQNLIPINTVVDYLMRTIKKDGLPTIMNFVAKQSVKNNDIINCICDKLPINIISQKQLDKNSMTPLERLIDIGMSFTGDYSDIKLQFDTKNLDKIISSKRSEVTNKSLQLMLDFFINNSLQERQIHNSVV